MTLCLLLVVICHPHNIACVVHRVEALTPIFPLLFIQPFTHHSYISLLIYVSQSHLFEIVFQVTSTTMDQDPPRTRLALPRARSVSHLRSQTSSSIPVPRPGLSRKPSIPLRSNVTTNANANAYVASQRQQTTSSHASSVIVAASTGMRAVPVPGGVRAQSVLELGRRTVTGTGNGDGSSRMDDPFLVRVASHSNPTSRTQHQAKAQTQTLPTRTRPIGQSTTTTTTGGRNKPLPTRPALQGPVTATTTTRSRQVGHTPMALGAKRTVSAVPPTTATAHAQAQAQHTSFKPTSTHKGTGTSTTTLVRKPSGRLRGSPVPAPALALARPQVPFTTTTRTGSGSNITRAPVRPATIPTPAAAAASAPAQPQVPASPSPLPTTEATPGPKLHYGQPPLGRQIRRVVSRGFALSQPTISPDKTIRKSHSTHTASASRNLLPLLPYFIPPIKHSVIPHYPNVPPGFFRDDPSPPPPPTTSSSRG